jgi:alcohol dehydrogenase (cytochrome c)
VGAVWAISAETGRTLWKYEQRAGVFSLLATGGGLVFGGDASGRFRAFDERTGKVLWETNLGAPVSGYPITFASMASNTSRSPQVHQVSPMPRSA